MKTLSLFVCLMTLALFSYAQKGEFTDTRDGQVYKTIQIGSQTWMAENLNFDTAYSYCYNDDNSMCDRYGRLYEWEIAMEACPDSFHLPTEEEWLILLDFLGGAASAGTQMTAWASSGFKGLFAGRRLSQGDYYYKGSYGFFWSATESDKYKAKTITLKAGTANVPFNNYDKYSAYSVRCIKD